MLNSVSDRRLEQWIKELTLITQLAAKSLPLRILHWETLSVICDRQMCAIVQVAFHNVRSGGSFSSQLGA